MSREAFETMHARQEREHAARLAFIRNCLACGLKVFTTPNPN